ncbi:MAG: ferredoxin family protein [Gemmataceae bacterium]|nr:ferredoxin family protein [Gemmataceae bacterium]MDW8266278.1 ferredoxin family protein [Gemmataceae bacterium]
MSRLTVVVSQAQGKHPARRALEESLTAALIMEPGLDVSVVPHLYDLDAQHTGRLFLESIRGDMVVLCWMYPRAAFWLLDRDGIKGHWGETRLKPPDADEEEEADPEPAKGIGSVNVPDRYIYCLDLRDFPSHEPYVEEVRRIAAECRERRAAERSLASGEPTLVPLGVYPRRAEAGAAEAAPEQAPAFSPESLLAPPARRWYPVIDYSRCTNCMECIDFCLFGVYGVDRLDRIIVENPDNCKRGCPACSRVCPEHAIMFPEYKSPAIAGAAIGGVNGLKIDLSKLFGGSDALQIAAQERDRELIAAGREAVGLSVGIPKRQANKSAKPKDELDNLIDALDSLDL